MNGEKLDEITKQREIGKRPYQKVLLGAGFALACGVIVLLVVMLFKILSFF